MGYNKKIFEEFWRVFVRCNVVYVNGVISRNVHDKTKIYGLEDKYIGDNITSLELISYDIKNRILKLKTRE